MKHLEVAYRGMCFVNESTVYGKVCGVFLKITSNCGKITSFGNGKRPNGWYKIAGPERALLFFLGGGGGRPKARTSGKSNDLRSHVTWCKGPFYCRGKFHPRTRPMAA